MINTREEWKKLTTDEKKTELAKIDGWGFFHVVSCTDSESRSLVETLIGLPQNDSPGGPWPIGNHPLREYLTDVNVMIQSVAAVDEEIQSMFYWILQAVTGAGQGTDNLKMVNASAEDRAQALTIAYGQIMAKRQSA